MEFVELKFRPPTKITRYSRRNRLVSSIGHERASAPGSQVSREISGLDERWFIRERRPILTSRMRGVRRTGGADDRKVIFQEEASVHDPCYSIYQYINPRLNIAPWGIAMAEFPGLKTRPPTLPNRVHAVSTAERSGNRSSVRQWKRRFDVFN